MKRIFAIALACAMSLTLLVGCGKKEDEQQNVNVDLHGFFDTVVENHPFSNNFFESASLEKDEMGILDMLYPELKDLAAEVYVYSSMVMQDSEMVLVKAKDAESLETVKGILEQRVADMTREGCNYPEVVEVWATNSAVVTEGNYAMLIAHADATAITEEFNALFK